jgi:hypothetical protein
MGAWQRAGTHLPWQPTVLRRSSVSLLLLPLLLPPLLLLLLLLQLQIHVKGSEVMYFSRRGREHGRLSDYVVFDEVIRRQVRMKE